MIEPRCQHFGVCGGCKHQHISYSDQLAQKQIFVQECFRKEAEPILPCEPEWHYRNKMEFSFSQSKSGEKFLGLMKKRGRVENISECYLTSPWFANTLNTVREWWLDTNLTAYHPPKNQGLLRTLTLREGIHSKEKMVVLTISEEPFDENALQEFILLFPDVDSVILRRQIIAKKTPTRFEETLLQGQDHIHEILHDESGRPYTFRIRAASFFQPNTLQAETLYQKVMELSLKYPHNALLDLYCGTGSLGIFASRFAKQVLGIELVPEAVEDAHHNLKLNQISTMDILEGDVAQVLSGAHFQPDLIFVDPPRAGLGKTVVEKLREISPETILYVSCNPISQAADCEALGYKIISLHPVDQFPHTPHIENIAVLIRA